MGNYNTRNITFRQSQFDFPLTVALGEKSPSWGLSRWGGNSPLRFLPLDDEGFTLRGDKRRLVYKGRRRSHRFTILSDGSFEYDVVLNREPESNVVVLPMEGAEQFDFFRQPDFIKDPFLAGSYAVYKKETLIGEGTGKLCHIHRPLIIDARGRRCWGDLSVVGNCLCITIPEQWLADAKYPVVVDPTIGTTTVGSQTHWDNVDNESYDQLFIEVSLAVNRFLVPETLNNLATAYVYAYDRDYEGDCKPVLYSDNNNVPLARRSMSEGTFDIAVGNGKPAGWRSAAFRPNTSIAGGSYIWFGLFSFWFAPRFDYGAKCYIDYWYEIGDDIPDIFPHGYWDYYYDFKLSMYFTYTTAQNYVRKITQGVKLGDTRKLTAVYKRNAKQTVKINSAASRLQTFCRNCVMTAHSVMNAKRYPIFFRKATEIVKAETDNSVMRSLLRNCVDNLTANSVIKRIQSFTRVIREAVKIVDNFYFPVVMVRVVADKTVAYEVTRHSAEYIKILEARADIAGEGTHIANYRRLNTETIQAEGSLFRGLIMLVRLFSSVVLRDYFLRRFLKAREELKLKSCISREITLDSKII